LETQKLQIGLYTLSRQRVPTKYATGSYAYEADDTSTLKTVSNGQNN